MNYTAIKQRRVEKSIFQGCIYLIKIQLKQQYCQILKLYLFLLMYSMNMLIWCSINIYYYYYY